MMLIILKRMNDRDADIVDHKAGDINSSHEKFEQK